MCADAVVADFQESGLLRVMGVIFRQSSVGTSDIVSRFVGAFNYDFHIFERSILEKFEDVWRVMLPDQFKPSIIGDSVEQIRANQDQGLYQAMSLPLARTAFVAVVSHLIMGTGDKKAKSDLDAVWSAVENLSIPSLDDNCSREDAAKIVRVDHARTLNSVIGQLEKAIEFGVPSLQRN